MRGIHCFNYIFILLSLILFTASCGNQTKSSSSNDFSATPRSQSSFDGDLDGIDDSDSGSNSGTQRECFNPISNLNETALATFFGEDVQIQNREGPASACIFSSGSGSTLVYYFRLEYEDDFGVRTYSSNAQSSQTEYLSSVTDPNNTELIFMDNIGFLQLVGQDNGSGSIELEIKFSNLPSYYQKDSNGDYILDASGRAIPTSSSADFTTQRSCLDSSNGDAKLSNGSACSAGYRFPRSFWKSSWWGISFSDNQLSNLLTMVREYTNNSYPSDFSSSNLNIVNGSIGRFLTSALE